MDYLSSLVGTFGDGDEAVERSEEAELVPYEGMGALICPSCDWPNPPNLAICQQCRKALHSMGQDDVEEEAGELVAIPEFYQPLFQACHDVAAGRIPIEEWEGIWQAVVVRMQGIAQGVQGQLVQLRDPDQDTVDTCQRLFSNLESALGELDKMGGYIEERDAQILNHAWMSLVKATGGIHQSAKEFAQLREAALIAEQQAAKKKA